MCIERRVGAVVPTRRPNELLFDFLKIVIPAIVCPAPVIDC